MTEDRPMQNLFEPHHCRIKAGQPVKSWADGCIICDIEMMYVRCILMEPDATIVRGGDWVMIGPPPTFPVDRLGMFKFNDDEADDGV